MSDRDIEQVADAAADGLREQLAEALCPRWEWEGTPRRPCSPHHNDAVALLPVAKAYAAAQVAAERKLLPAENMNLTVARAQLERGDNPKINVTAMLVMTIDRLTAWGAP